MANVTQLPLSRALRPYSPDAQVGVIIQARMTSKRFPGKVLHLLDGKPVIQHVIEQCKQIRAPSKVKKPIKLIVAVPDTPESEPLLNLVTDKLGIENACGPEDNVLERYMGAASYFKLDVIMRITSDCPLINPKVCSEVLQLLMWRKLDYASNCHDDRTFPKGFDCEVFTYDCLEFTWGMVKEERQRWENHLQDPRGHILAAGQFLKDALYDQEHVTPFMTRHKDIRKGLVKKIGKSTPNINLCVDVPEDIARLEKIIEKEKRIPHILKMKASNDNAR